MRIKGPMTPDDPRHGTYNGYVNLSCRCTACRAANAAAVRRMNANRRARGLPEGDPRHGTENGYGNWGCRCDPCTAAWSAGCLARLHRRREASR